MIFTASAPTAEALDRSRYDYSPGRPPSDSNEDPYCRAFLADPGPARRNALVAAVRDAIPGLTEARLVRVDEETWIDFWRWDSAASAQAAAERARAGGFPEAGAAFELTRDLTTEFTEVVDER